jgi:hypothetical protein
MSGSGLQPMKHGYSAAGAFLFAAVLGTTSAALADSKHSSAPAPAPHPSGGAPHMPGGGGGVHMPGSMGGGAHVPGSMGGGAHVPGNMGGGAHVPGNMGGGAHTPSSMGGAHTPGNMGAHTAGGAHAAGGTGAHTGGGNHAAVGESHGHGETHGTGTQHAEHDNPFRNTTHGAGHEGFGAGHGTEHAGHDPRIGGHFSGNTRLAAGVGIGVGAGIGLHAHFGVGGHDFMHAPVGRDIGRDRAFAAAHAHDFHARFARDFTRGELARWSGGKWGMGWHYGRLGWWWDVDGVWYPYDEPIWPYPLEVSALTVYGVDTVDGPYAALPDIPPLPPAPAGLYSCASPQGYFPGVASCAQPWELTQAAPPQDAPPPQ